MFEDFDGVEFIGFCFGIFILFLVIFGTLGLIHLIYLSPVNAGIAMKECNDRGYSSYEDYQDKFLTHKVYAVRCKDIPLSDSSVAISIAK
jgi:hypothetical protein